MKYKLLRETINLIEEFENEQPAKSHFPLNISGFKRWIYENHLHEIPPPEPDWEGKAQGRSPESVINTLIVHMNRYAKSYSKSAIHDSDFRTQEDFIYLINLKAFGAMSKMDLVKKNIQEMI